MLLKRLSPELATTARRAFARLFSVLLIFCASPAHAADFLPAGAQVRYYPGADEPSPSNLSAWRQLPFDDSGWQIGALPLFYGEALVGTELANMRGLYSSVYTRQTFDVANPADVQTLTLRVLSDDGFVAWLNGEEVVRFNVSEGVETFNGTAIQALSEPLPYIHHDIATPAARLVQGRNVLAIMGFNSSIGSSSDFVLDHSLSYTRDDTAPVVERVLPSPGAVVRAMSSLEIQFSESINGLDAADLLINGQGATNVAEFGPGQFVFAFPPVPAGPVQIAFRADHGITDRSPAAHPFAGGSWSFTVDPTAPAPGVIISEFMANNDRTLRDDDGDKSDWIELFNSSAQAASLAGWHLTDDSTRPTKWTFPSVTLAPNTYLLVYASGKNRTNAAKPLHTNFKLATEGGSYLALVNAGGQIVSAFTSYPAQIKDVSYGRANGAPNVLGYFPKPTPGNPNTVGGNGFAAPVEFSATSQTYQTNITVSLSTTNAATVIRYTIDGTLPSETSPIYTNSLSFTNIAMRLRARGFAPGLLPGEPRTETFIPLSSTVASFTSDLPVLIIHDFNAGRPPANSDTFAFTQVFMPDTNGVTTLTNLPAQASRSIIAARGSSTEGYPKVSLKLELQDEFGFDRDLPLAGLPTEADWVLYAPNNFEPVLIHNPFAFQLSRDIGQYAPRTRFVEVYFVQSGVGAVQSASYNGIYVLMEKIKIDDNRVNIAKLSPPENLPPKVTGGYLLKVDRLDPGDGGMYAANQGMGFVDPKEEELRAPEWTAQMNYLQNYMDSFGNALYGQNYRDPVTGYAAYVDVDSWIDHHLINVLCFNVDALRLSAYFHKPRGKKLKFGPVWDFDRALNSTDGRDSNPTVWRSQSGDGGTDFFYYTWWDRLFTDPDFFQAYIDRFQELRRNEFSTTNLNRLTDDLVNQVRRAQPREQARWGGNAPPRMGFQGEVSALKTWLSTRASFMDGQFVRPPAFSRPAGSVTNGTQITLTVPPNTTVYYTLDGADPRRKGTATGNDLAPGAKTYTGPITLTANSRLVARARNLSFAPTRVTGSPPLTSVWSGNVEATYVVNPFPITISEIMYHPAGDGANNGFEADDFEFIELLNQGTTAVNLLGFEIKGGIDFTFRPTNNITSLAAGARLVLVKDLAAFNARYPLVAAVAGEYSNNLGNDGNRIALFGPLQEPVFDFRYEATWQTNTDGAGRSLVLIDESTAPAALGQGASWRASANNGGSPGVADPAPATTIQLSASVVAGGLTIHFTGQPGASYTLQRRADFAAATWQDIQTLTAPANGAVEFTDPLAGSANYYRVQGPN
jgi:hypothetical protein